jgi:anhydro-N-acetylmuramic acid kinase
MDGVDIALVSFNHTDASTVAGATIPYPAPLRNRIAKLIVPEQRATPHEIATLDVEVGQHFGHATTAFLNTQGVAPSAIVAIGSHGQTLRHHPFPPAPYSWQIGEPATIAALTGITTVANFRSLDVAYGGEGAPLVPPFHQWCFGASGIERVAVNIGGIANISVLNGTTAAVGAGYDCGPGNCLLDEWCQRHQGQAFDPGGAWAAAGPIDQPLLRALLAEQYFSLPAPKSTGRELFNIAFVDQALQNLATPRPSPASVQSTLAQLTVESIAQAIERDSTQPDGDVYVCGGGAHNNELMRRLQERLHGRKISSTDVLGIAPDFVEAAAFAWLARQRISDIAVSLTTSRTPRPLLLGVIHEPRH